MHRYAKPFCALTAAVAAGLWLGINYMGMLVRPPDVYYDAPAWIGQAEWMAYAALGLLSISAVAWMALDYRQQEA